MEDIIHEDAVIVIGKPDQCWNVVGTSYLLYMTYSDLVKGNTIIIYLLMYLLWETLLKWNQHHHHYHYLASSTLELGPQDIV